MTGRSPPTRRRSARLHHAERAQQRRGGVRSAARLRAGGGAVSQGGGSAPELRRGVSQSDAGAGPHGRPGGLDPTVVAFKARLPGSSDLWQAELIAAWGKGQVDRADSIGRAAWARGPGVRQAVRAAVGTSAIAYLHGHRREGLRWATLRSDAMMRAVPTAASRLAFALDTATTPPGGDAAAGRAAIDRGLVRQPIDSVPPDERDCEGARHARSGTGTPGAEPARARRLRSGSEAVRARPIGRRAFFAAHVALAELKWDEALGLLREADTRKTVEDRYAMVQMGRAHEAAGRPDSAMGYYEKFLAMPDPFPVLDLAGARMSISGSARSTRGRARAGRPWSSLRSSSNSGPMPTRSCSRR